MANERIIGIDFGTSTSVMKVKSYKSDGKPLNGRIDTKSVAFNNGAVTVPTSIQSINSGGAKYYGYDAEVLKENAEVFRNFKLNLQSEDIQKREEARALTKEFFAYLYDTYNGQSIFLGDADDKETTIVSYPVKWKDETRKFMLQAAEDAGFSNVTGMDEAEAAIRAVTTLCVDLLKRRSYLVDGEPSNILLIDMGAGTTDIVLCSFIPGDKPQNEILCVWPKEGNVFFGGREADELLKNYIAPKIPNAYRETIIKNLEKNSTFKSWKETIVSPVLQSDKSVEDFGAANTLLQMLGTELEEFNLNRNEFEAFAADYLRNFPKLINDCLENGGISGDDIDMVIKTGGHSQWYFVDEMLTGRLNKFGEINISKIKSDPERIISVSLPQETVALGSVYSKISGSVGKREPELSEDPTELLRKGLRYYKGDPEYPKDIDEAEKLFKKAAELGVNDAKYFIGYIYFFHKEDYVESAKWYEKAAYNGNANAMNSLGFQYDKGLGVPQDKNKATEYFRKAAESGSILGVKNYVSEIYPPIQNLNLYAGNFAKHKDVIKKKMENFLKYYISMEIDIDSIILYYDNTIFGSGKDGFMMTDKLFMWRFMGEEDMYINISHIKCFSQYYNSVRLVTDVGKKYLIPRFRCDYDKQVLFLNDVLAIVNKYNEARG